MRPLEPSSRLNGWAEFSFLLSQELTRSDGCLKAVLFDRDGTLIDDVGYCSLAETVRPIDGAVEAVSLARSFGVATGVVTNQSGLQRGLFTEGQLSSINALIDDLFGPFDTWRVCPHLPQDGCSCRKPQPGLIHQACSDLGVVPSQAVVVGDRLSDVEAALLAGARGWLLKAPLDSNSFNPPKDTQ